MPPSTFVIFQAPGGTLYNSLLSIITRRYSEDDMSPYLPEATVRLPVGTAGFDEDIDASAGGEDGFGMPAAQVGDVPLLFTCRIAGKRCASALNGVFR